jgi:hypothetical protein
MKISVPPKKLANFSAFIVALVIIILISRRLYATFISIPNKTSVWRLLSCASSIIITLYNSKSGSLRLSLNKTPSVIYLILVFLLVWSSKRIEYPTSSPRGVPISSETRFATLTAATLLGYVHPINPKFEYPSSWRYYVSYVVLPEPVSPTIIVTLFSLIMFNKSSRTP